MHTPAWGSSMPTHPALPIAVNNGGTRSGGAAAQQKPSLAMEEAPAGPGHAAAVHRQPADPSQWLNFSMPPRQRHVPGSGMPGGPVIPRRSRRGESWRGSAMSRERFVHANFRFMLKPTETLSYGAHFADPDISLHWPHILQVLVPTFSAFSVAQGYVSSDPAEKNHDEAFARSIDDSELDGLGDESERRRRMEEERRGRMCPICLGKPVAGRMTKCGHIFCFPCILHYIQLSDTPKSAKCPICGDTIIERMLKSVKYLDAGQMLASARGEDDEEDSEEVRLSQTHQDHGHGHQMIGGELEGFEEQPAEPVASTSSEAHQDATPGHRVHMRLIQRPQMTTMALPSAPTWPSDAIPPHTVPWYFLPDVLSYSRYMLATPEYMLRELQRELAELKGEWDALAGDALGRDFVRAAKEKVEKQMGKVRAELMTDLVQRDEVLCNEAWGEAVGGERRERERRKERERRARERAQQARPPEPIDEATRAMLATESRTFDDIPPNRPVEPNPMPAPKRNRRRGANPSAAAVPPPSLPSYFFYQSSLGANVFLHPLDIRILLAHFKSYAAFPPAISFRSSGFDTGTINDELRKRCKYLSHLPAGTEVVFVEAELEDIVGKEGLAAFEQPLKARKAKRRDRAKREDRAKVKWEKAEKEKLPVMTPGACAGGAAGEDREFALALARSEADVQWSNDHPALGSSLGSSSSQPAMTGVSPSTSPTGTAVWGSHGQPRATFAHALHSHSASSTPLRRHMNDDPEIDAVWEAFDHMDLAEQRGTIRETEKGGGAGAGANVGGGKKGGKKAGKKTLVLGGGMGGRRA